MGLGESVFTSAPSDSQEQPELALDSSLASLLLDYLYMANTQLDKTFEDHKYFMKEQQNVS